MAHKHSIVVKHSFRIMTLALTLLLLLWVGGTDTAPKPTAAQAQMGGIPVVEPAPEPEGRVSTITPDPLIETMIDQVYSDTVSTYDRQLAGELPVLVDDGLYTITTRQTYSGVPIQKTTHFVGQHMAELGLDVEYHQWNSTTNPNVIGEIPGMTHPERIFIIGAHIDDVSSTPGADDNASGSVATLIAADILNQYKWDCTLRFAFWTGEEQGLLGSDYYAQRSYNRGENIEGYLNLDMIAWNTIGSSRDIDVIYNPNMPPTHDLALLFTDVISAYDINLIPQLLTSLGGGSDHQSFWDRGYTSILTIEDQSDFNPYYHRSTDTPAHTDLGYFTDFVKASIGTFAHMGCLLPATGNLIGTVSDAEGAPIVSAQVQAHRTPTQMWETVTNPDGSYALELASSVYTVTAQAPGFMNYSTSGIVVTNGFTTTLNISLLITPTFTLTGTVRDALSGEPLSATVRVVGSPITHTHTDPVTGQYAIHLMQGTYTLRAEDPYHYPQTVVVNLQGNQQQDFNLPSVCLLVVGDDHQYSSYYTDSLDRLGYDYQFTTQALSIDALSYYQGIVWLTGDQLTGTLTQSDQNTLAAYLDGGGRLFVSGQNIGQEIGSSSFFAEYLHASFTAQDAGRYVLNGLGFLDPLVDIFIQGGDGAGNQTSPDAIAPIGDGEAVYRYWANPLPEPVPYGGVAFTGTHRTVYFSFGFEAINRAIDRDHVLQATLDYLGTCTQPEAPQASFTASSGAGSRGVKFTNTSQGTPWMSYRWNFGDSSPASNTANPEHTYAQHGFYTVTLTVTSHYGEDIASAIVFMPYEVFLPVAKK
jgi:Zn-dependent M28 family amino/carboxypeptidase